MPSEVLRDREYEGYSTNAADVPAGAPEPGIFGKIWGYGTGVAGSVYNGVAAVPSVIGQIGATAYDTGAGALQAGRNVLTGAGQAIGETVGNALGGALRGTGAGLGGGLKDSLMGIVVPLAIILGILGVIVVLTARSGAVKVKALV